MMMTVIVRIVNSMDVVMVIVFVVGVVTVVLVLVIAKVDGCKGGVFIRTLTRKYQRYERHEEANLIYEYKSHGELMQREVAGV